VFVPVEYGPHLIQTPEGIGFLFPAAFTHFDLIDCTINDRFRHTYTANGLDLDKRALANLMTALIFR